LPFKQKTGFGGHYWRPTIGGQFLIAPSSFSFSIRIIRESRKKPTGKNRGRCFLWRQRIEAHPQLRETLPEELKEQIEVPGD
jgi:hypothetical protein